MSSDPHDDAEEALAEQTPVPVQIALLRLPNGTRYLNITRNADKRLLLASIALYERIIRESDTDTPAWHRATLARENALELAYIYALLSRPEPAVDAETASE